MLTCADDVSLVAMFLSLYIFISVLPVTTVNFYCMKQLYYRGLGIVILSVTRVLCDEYDETKEHTADILIPHERGSF